MTGPSGVPMSRLLKRFVPCLGTVLVLGAAAQTGAQADPQNYLFNSGQTIQPFFNGWAHNPDGSFEFHFGYLNRNYVEELHVPVGPDNHVTPDDPDRGQPTYFYPRQLSRVFSVTVPADWGTREVTWRVTVGRETHQAVGWLQPEWEIDDNAAANRLSEEVLRANQAPALSLDTPGAASVGSPLTLTAAVSDDGLPEPRRPGGGGGGGGNVLPTFARQPDGPTLPINVPQLQTRNRHRPTRTRVDRVNLTWTQMRGPAGARLAPADTSADGETAVTVSFAQPGDYLFRVQASDGPATIAREFAITVR